MTEPGNRYNARLEGQPQPGQWWVLNESERQIHTDPKSQVVFFCGRDAKGRVIFEDPDGNVEVDEGLDWRNWHHEPACTGWDWVAQDKAEYPQWYIPTFPILSGKDNKPIACYRRDSEHSGETFHTDGSSFKWSSWDGMTYATQCSESQAMIKIQPFAEELRNTIQEVRDEKTKDVDDLLNAVNDTSADSNVVEGPEDWVTQDRVHARKDVDEYRWVWGSGNPSAWTPVYLPERYDFSFHGHVDEQGDRFECRCRRKDLPVVEEKAKVATVTVYEVVYGDDLAKAYVHFCVGEQRLEDIRSLWKYVSVVSTKTVEVML